jgi:hypothetical protein
MTLRTLTARTMVTLTSVLLRTTNQHPFASAAASAAIITTATSARITTTTVRARRTPTYTFASSAIL